VQPNMLMLISLHNHSIELKCLMDRGYKWLAVIENVGFCCHIM